MIWNASLLKVSKYYDIRTIPLINWIDFCERPDPRLLLKRGVLSFHNAEKAAERLIEQYKKQDDSGAGNYEVIEKYQTLSYRHDFILYCVNYLMQVPGDEDVEQIIRDFGYDPDNPEQIINKLNLLASHANRFKGAIEQETSQVGDIRSTLYEVVTILEKWLGAQLDLNKTTLERFINYRKMYVKSIKKQDNGK